MGLPSEQKDEAPIEGGGLSFAGLSMAPVVDVNPQTDAAPSTLFASLTASAESEPEPERAPEDPFATAATICATDLHDVTAERTKLASRQEKLEAKASALQKSLFDNEGE
jgi:hypothetical protein